MHVRLAMIEVNSTSIVACPLKPEPITRMKTSKIYIPVRAKIPTSVLKKYSFPNNTLSGLNII